MSGGAGKVYFVLYLAVVLELLIIIVERDEAEEHLLKKQKESMKIVESILSQLQSGAGTEGINTRPQDEITLPPPGVNIKEVMGADLKSWRKYIVEVGITDVSNDLKRIEGESEKDYNERLKKLVELANVAEIEYQIFYSPSENPDNAPLFPSDEEISKQYKDFENFQPGQTVQSSDGEIWEFLSKRKLVLDVDQTYNSLDLRNITPAAIQPKYPKEKITFVGPSFCPKEVPEDSVFCYSEQETLKEYYQSGKHEIKKRAFLVHFQPPDKKGWYKLRFSSRTNRILGVRADIKPQLIDKETKINIGTVQLTVEALEKVKKELKNKLEKFDLPSEDLLIEKGDLEAFDKKLAAAKEHANREEDAVELRGKIELYGYIVKLLAPGQSRNFKQNRGAIEFNVRVITPKPQIAEPVISAPEVVYTFDKIEAAFEFQISPYQGGNNRVFGRVLDVNKNVVAKLNLTPLDQIAGLNWPKPTPGGKQDWKAILDQTLPPGIYTIELSHQVVGKTKVENISLEVFETKITNQDEINARLTFLSVYGGKIAFNAIPASGGKIKSNQFRIYLNTDIDQQKPPIEGLTVEDALEISSNAKKVTTMITWIQPGTNKEITLLPKKTYEIKQKPPDINSRKLNIDASSDDGKKIKIKISNIEILSPIIGTSSESKGKSAIINVKAKNGTINLKGGAYEFSSDPTVETEIDGGSTIVTITAELSGQLDRGEQEISGNITLELQATAVNPINNSISDTRKEPLSIPIKVSIEKKRGGAPGTTKTPVKKPAGKK